LRRCAVSIASNIAEGHGRDGTREFLNFLSMAYGSLNESETQILIAERLGFVTAESSARLMEMAAEIGRLLNGLRNSLRSKLSP
jgi:four helix bundle protein